MNYSMEMILHIALAFIWLYGFAREFERYVVELVEHSYTGTFKGWLRGFIFPLNHYTIVSFFALLLGAFLVFILWPVSVAWRVARGEN